jgi:hypothetical protein
MIGAHADADFKDVFPGAILESRKLWDVRLESVPGLSLSLELPKQ